MSHIISTVNVNGVRAAAVKGLLTWLTTTEADIICLQETRANDAQIEAALVPAFDDGWYLAHAQPGIKGRAGVGVLSRQPARAVRVGLPGSEFGAAGRYIEVDFDDVSVASVYVYTGEAETPKQEEKYRFLGELARRLQTRTGPFVVAGDWNIAHTERDLKNWKANRKKAGFLPKERAWVSACLTSGYVDVVRELHPNVDGPYSWWSYRGRAFDTDAGWRIDYHLALPELASRAKRTVVERAETYAQRWSDHAPVTVWYE